MTDHTLPRHKNARNDLTAEYVRSILDYDPETGEFRWKYRSDVGKAWNTRYSGKPAGFICKTHGRLVIVVGDTHYQGHRVAWLHHTGEWPGNEIDHIDGDPTNNRISNLRECTSAQNKMNKVVQRNNKLGIKGVFFNKERNKYTAKIKASGKHIHLGHFANVEAAKAAYDMAEKLYFGDFSLNNSRKSG